MRKHTMALSYPPKIFPFFVDVCKQTIRANRKVHVAVGDRIKFYGWKGIAYRSKWGWEKDVFVSEVIDCLISVDGIETDAGFYDWNSSYANRLAQLDFIDPPTGIGLRDVLFKLNDGAPDAPVKAQIIRW